MQKKTKGDMKMDYEMMENNKVFLKGVVTAEPKYSHELFGEAFYELNLKVPRLSDNFDYIPVTVSEKLLTGKDFEVGKEVAIKGQYRSYNKYVNGKSKLFLTVFVRDIIEMDDSMNPNVVEVEGYVCKEPIFRTTPFGREICDVLLAVNRSYNKSDYIPCIAWGRNARYVRHVKVGQKLEVIGRIQSREYQKKISETESETRIAYEVSMGKIHIVDEDSEQNEKENDKNQPA